MEGRIDAKESHSHDFPSIQHVAGCIYQAFETTYMHKGKQVELPDAPDHIAVQQEAQRRHRRSDKVLYNSCDMLRVK